MEENTKILEEKLQKTDPFPPGKFDAVNYFSVMKIKGGYVYIITNKNKTTLYIDVTSNLPKRILEHRDHEFQYSFSDKYNLEYCIYFEHHQTIELAIAREKQLKKWSRKN